MSTSLHTDTLEAYHTKTLGGRWVQIDRIASWGSRQAMLTLRPDQARELARQLTEAADAAHAAEYDEASLSACCEAAPGLECFTICSRSVYSRRARIG